MALNGNGSMTPADIAAVTGGNNGFNGDGSWWFLVLILFAMFNGGWTNGNGGSNGEVQRGFDQQAVMSGLAGVQSGQADILGAFNAANLNLLGQLSQIAANQQSCCCDTRQAISDLRYSVGQEAANDRAAVSSALRDVMTQNSSNTQRILDELCDQKIQNLQNENQNLRTQLNMAALNASQSAQTAQILADNARQTTALEQYLNPVPIPAYMVQNPNCCGYNNWNNCIQGMA